MEREYTCIKETYQRVGYDEETDTMEFNRINPYKNAVDHIRKLHENAIIVKASTEVAVFGSLQVPILTVKYKV